MDPVRQQELAVGTTGVIPETTGSKLPPDRHNQTPTLVTEVANCSTGKKTSVEIPKPSTLFHFIDLLALRVIVTRDAEESSVDTPRAKTSQASQPI